MIVFQEQEHDFTGTTYTAVSRNYRWWVNIDHDKNRAAEIQVCRLATIDGVRTVGKHVYSNIPDSDTVNTLDPKLVAKMEGLSLKHHLQNGRKGDYLEYKKPFRSGGLGSPLAAAKNVVGGGAGGQSNGFNSDAGLRRPKSMYGRDSKYGEGLEFYPKGGNLESEFHRQPRSEKGANRFY